MAESSQYEIDRFVGAAEAAGPPDWLDDLGRSIGRREGAIEVRLSKRTRTSVLSVRLTLEHARRLGLIREVA